MAPAESVASDPAAGDPAPPGPCALFGEPAGPHPDEAPARPQTGFSSVDITTAPADARSSHELQMDVHFSKADDVVARLRPCREALDQLGFDARTVDGDHQQGSHDSGSAEVVPIDVT